MKEEKWHDITGELEIPILKGYITRLKFFWNIVIRQQRLYFTLQYYANDDAEVKISKLKIEGEAGK